MEGGRELAACFPHAPADHDRFRYKPTVKSGHAADRPVQVEQGEYVHDDDDGARPGGSAGCDGARPVVPQGDPVQVGPDRYGKGKERKDDQRHGTAHGKVMIHAD